MVEPLVTPVASDVRLTQLTTCTYNCRSLNSKTNKLQAIMDYIATSRADITVLTEIWTVFPPQHTPIGARYLMTDQTKYQGVMLLTNHRVINCTPILKELWSGTMLAATIQIRAADPSDPPLKAYVIGYYGQPSSQQAQ